MITDVLSKQMCQPGPTYIVQWALGFHVSSVNSISLWAITIVHPPPNLTPGNYSRLLVYSERRRGWESMEVGGKMGWGLNLWLGQILSAISLQCLRSSHGHRDSDTS